MAYSTLSDIMNRMEERELIQLADDDVISNLDLASGAQSWESEKDYFARSIIEADGFYYLSNLDGKTGDTEPTWSTIPGAVVEDEEIEWTLLDLTPWDRVEAAIADADEEIDGHLGSVLSLPLAVVPSILRKLSADIAIFNLYSRKMDTIPDARMKRYDNAVKFLQQVATGKISLGADDPSGSPSSSGISYYSNDKVFTADKMVRF